MYYDIDFLCPKCNMYTFYNAYRLNDMPYEYICDDCEGVFKPKRCSLSWDHWVEAYDVVVLELCS